MEPEDEIRRRHLLTSSHFSILFIPLFLQKIHTSCGDKTLSRQDGGPPYELGAAG